MLCHEKKRDQKISCYSPFKDSFTGVIDTGKVCLAGVIVTNEKNSSAKTLTPVKIFLTVKTSLTTVIDTVEQFLTGVNDTSEANFTCVGDTGQWIEIHQ